MWWTALAYRKKRVTYAATEKRMAAVEKDAAERTCGGAGTRDFAEPLISCSRISEGRPLAQADLQWSPLRLRGEGDDPAHLPHTRCISKLILLKGSFAKLHRVSQEILFIIIMQEFSLSLLIARQRLRCSFECTRRTASKRREEACVSERGDNFYPVL